MDIARLSMNMNNIALQSKVGVAVLDQTMEINEQLSTGIIDMMEMVDVAAMERSVNPNVGSNFDMRV